MYSFILLVTFIKYLLILYDKSDLSIIFYTHIDNQ
jgi:hypothetical protein